MNPGQMSPGRKWAVQPRMESFASAPMAECVSGTARCGNETARCGNETARCVPAVVALWEDLIADSLARDVRSAAVMQV